MKRSARLRRTRPGTPLAALALLVASAGCDDDPFVVGDASAGADATASEAGTAPDAASGDSGTVAGRDLACGGGKRCSGGNVCCVSLAGDVCTSQAGCAALSGVAIVCDDSSDCAGTSPGDIVCCLKLKPPSDPNERKMEWTKCMPRSECSATPFATAMCATSADCLPNELCVDAQPSHVADGPGNRICK